MRLNIEVLTLIVGALQTNCYLVIDKKSLSTLIIDPGDDADYISRIIKDRGYQPVQIIATHGHFDHILGIAELKLAYNIPFCLHKKDQFLIKNMAQSAKHFLSVDAGPSPEIDIYLTGKKNITIGKSNLEIIETPGHTTGSVCLYLRKEKLLFTGDLLFADGGVGRTDFSYSSYDNLRKSLQKIFRLPDDVVIYPGHGPSSTLKNEINFHFPKTKS